MIEANIARILPALERITGPLKIWNIVRILKDLSPAVLERLPGLRERLQPLLAMTDLHIGDMASDILYLAKQAPETTRLIPVGGV